jgi:hypothetical protein
MVGGTWYFVFFDAWCRSGKILSLQSLLLRALEPERVTHWRLLGGAYSGPKEGAHSGPKEGAHSGPKEGAHSGPKGGHSGPKGGAYSGPRGAHSPRNMPVLVTEEVRC